ncbi:MAG: alkaline phosphatase family protein [Anaerolineae bacterium]|nr:alkaline phosphatase family protein [Anaerolineae bacterium]
MTKTGDTKALIIGLDGATFDLMDPLLAAGQLPHLARLMAEGTWGRLRSVLPPNSAPAWAAFLTGKNPGRTGILNFRILDLRNYSGYANRFASSAAFAGQTFLDALSQQGRGVLAYRVPMTYPVWPVQGVMVAGYPTPDRRRAYTFPPELADELTPIALHSHDEILTAGVAEERRNADFEIESTGETMTRFLQAGEQDLYVCVSGITDGYQHKFWKYIDPQHPLYDPAEGARYGDIIAEAYRKLDGLVGRLVAQVGPDWLVMILSDHGGGPRPAKALNLNAWLQQQGWLRAQAGNARPLRQATRHLVDWARFNLPFLDWANRHLPERIRAGISEIKSGAGLIDWGKTRAFRVPLQYPAEGIEINLRGRQPQGIVEPGAEYEAVRSAILEALQGLTDPEDGRPLVREAYRREEVYTGPFLEEMPDIVLLTDPAYDGGAGVDRLITEVPLSFLARRSGDHLMEGVLILRGEGLVRRGQRIEGATITDLAPTILYALGCPIPRDMDGRVLTEALEPDLLARQPVVYGEPLGTGSGEGTAGQAYSDEDEAGIRKALEGLGYI